MEKVLFDAVATVSPQVIGSSINPQAFPSEKDLVDDAIIVPGVGCGTCGDQLSPIRLTPRASANVLGDPSIATRGIANGVDKSVIRATPFIISPHLAQYRFRSYQFVCNQSYQSSI